MDAAAARVLPEAAPPEPRTACAHELVHLVQPDELEPDRVVAVCLSCGAVSLARRAAAGWQACDWVALRSR